MGVRRIAPWKKWLFAAGTSGLVLLMLELILWLAGVPTLIERADPFRGFSGLVSVFERDGKVYRTRRAVVGNTFNDQTFLADKPAGGLRLFCLGGSSAYGFPRGADVAFTSIVGEALTASHPERQVEAVNAAGISYAMHRLNLVADELLAHKPDVFLVYEGHNEFIERAFFDSLRTRGTTRNRLEYALAHSRIYSGSNLLAERLRKPQASTSDPLDLVVRRDQSRIYSPSDKEAIVAEFRQQLERLVRRAQERNDKVVLATVPCNLRDWRPEASAGVALTASDRQRWSEWFASGQTRLKQADFTAAVADLELAAILAPHHAKTQFVLAQAYEGLGRFSNARAAYQRACDEDASPSRRVSGINTAIREVAKQSGALLVDIDRIFEQRSEHGLVGNNLIEDYVHPTPAGHQLIAWHMWEAMERAGWFGAKSTAQRTLFDRLVARRGPHVQTRIPAWFYNQGVILKKQGQVEAAIKSYRQALLAAPNHTGALLNLGSALLDTGQFSEAVGICERLVALSPASAEAHVNFGVALNAVGRPQQAIEQYQEALRIKPDLASAHNNWGLALQLPGRAQEAIEHYHEALRIKPDYAEAQFNWGNALGASGRPHDAIVHYQEALRLKPDYAEAHVNWGSALGAVGRPEEAIEHWQQALRIKPNSAEAHLNWGRALATMGRPQEAIAHWREALRNKPDLAEAHYNWGTALAVDGQLVEAAAHFQQALQLKPDYPAARDNLRRAEELMRQKSGPVGP